jgi:hypothetical protein
MVFYTACAVIRETARRVVKIIILSADIKRKGQFMNKRKMVTMGLLAVALVCGMALEAGCKDAETNPFIGTWKATDVTVDFTETTWTMTVGNETSTGTYTRSGNTATLKEEVHDDMTATVNGNTMTLPYGRYTFSLTKI